MIFNATGLLGREFGMSCANMIVLRWFNRSSSGNTMPGYSKHVLLNVQASICALFCMLYSLILHTFSKFGAFDQYYRSREAV
jgi:hypothetical protein